MIQGFRSLEKNVNLEIFTDFGMFLMAEIFPGSSRQPFLSKINPSYCDQRSEKSLTRKTYYWIRSKTENRSFRNSLLYAPAAIMSSINAATPVKLISMASNVCWNMAGTYLTPKERRLHLNKPLWVLTIRTSLEPSSIPICKKAKQVPQSSFAKRSSNIGNAYWCASKEFPNGIIGPHTDFSICLLCKQWELSTESNLLTGLLKVAEGNPILFLLCKEQHKENGISV